MSESKKDVVLARNLLFPKLKAVDFHSIEFNSSNPQEDIYSDVDGKWYYTQYPMVSITKSFTDLTFNKKISELLTANNFDQNNLKVRGQLSSWQEGDFTIQTNSTGNNLNTITITNDNYAHAEAIKFKETDLTNKTYNLDWIIGFKIFDGAEMISIDNTFLKATGVPLYFKEDSRTYILIPYVDHFSIAKHLINKIIDANGGKESFEELYANGWDYIFECEKFVVGYLSEHLMVRINKLS